MKKPIYAFIILIFLITAFPACAQVSNRQREHVSNEMLKQIRKEGEIEELTDEERIRSVFDSLVSHTKRKEIKYSPSIVKNKNINAYAMPNGKIVFYSGLIDALPKNNLSPIAFVMAHEISHIERKHAEKRMQNAILTGVALTVISRKSDDWVKALSGLSFALLVSGYSRSNETEADQDAVILMSKAGYDPNGALIVLNLFQEIEKKKSGIRIFPSHPRAQDRYKNIAGWMEKENIAIKGGGVANVEIGEKDEAAEKNPGGSAVISESNKGATIDEPVTDTQETEIFREIPVQDYSSITGENFENSFFDGMLEKKALADIKNMINPSLSTDQKLSLLARNESTYGAQTSSNEDEMIIVFLSKSEISYGEFLNEFNRAIIPGIGDKAQGYARIGLCIRQIEPDCRQLVVILKK